MCISDYQRSILADNKKVSEVLNLSNLKDQMPSAVFEKSLLKAFFYMFFDFGMVFASIAAIVYLHSSGIYAALPQWQQYAATFLYWNVAGFFMWGLFVVGHDCGHGTFSDSTILNDIIGHLTHGSILVPYYPWQLSHRRHHMYHNHVDKDYSHPWYTPDKLEKPEFWLARMMENFPSARFVFPFIGWPLYLYGMPDGSHWIPFSDQRLWKDTDKQEYFKCLVSTAVVLVNSVAIYYLCEQNMMNILYFYLAPWVVFSWWLVTVTYLQHHDHDTVVYGDEDWKFVNAAFQTVDRKFGFGLDALHHHITDGHVVHHIFFTKIPHYNLPKATNALVNYLKANQLDFLYKSDICYDFPYRVHKYMVQFGLSATRATTTPAVSEKVAAKKDQ